VAYELVKTPHPQRQILCQIWECRHGTPFFFTKSLLDGLATPWHSQLVNHGNRKHTPRHRQHIPATGRNILRLPRASRNSKPKGKGLSRATAVKRLTARNPIK